MRGVRITDRDKGFRKLLRRVKGAARGRGVTVGIHSGEGAAPVPGGGTVVDVGSIHEFGLGDVPERSFIRRWADEDKEELRSGEKKLAQSIVKGQNTAEAALEKMGVLFAAKAQKFISDGRATPKLDDATKDRKGSSTPLIDTGQLRSSITHQVE